MIVKVSEDQGKDSECSISDCHYLCLRFYSIIHLGINLTHGHFYDPGYQIVSITVHSQSECT